MVLGRPEHTLPPAIERLLAERDLAAAFEQRPPYQRNDYIAWITRAKREETRAKRVAQLIQDLEAGDRYMNMVFSPRSEPEA